MMTFNDILVEIDKGRKGLNYGTSMGLPKLESIIDGVSKGVYTLIISSSGSGKSSFALYAYVYRPLMEHMDDDNFRVLFMSLEMSPLSMYIKLLSIYIFETFGKCLSYKDILSKNRNKILSDEDYKYVLNAEEWFKKIEKKIEFFDKNITASRAYALICSRLEECGKFTETETRKIYTPNNPDMTYVVVIDHIGLIRPENGRGLKQEIDLLSAYLVTLREMAGISPVVIQQSNREHGSMERLRAGRSAFTMNDAKDTGNTVNDCNIMLGLFDPNKDGLKNYRGYEVDTLNGKFRSCQILKNRFGECDIEVPLNFFGNINYFSELPAPEDIEAYCILNSPSYLLNGE